MEDIKGVRGDWLRTLIQLDCEIIGADWYIIGRLLNVDSTAPLLVGAGTAICDGSAIAVAAPVVEAKEKI